MADTDPASQDNQEGVDRPDWLPENFKSPEDLATSYRESQRKITEEATARRNLEQLVAQQQAELEQMQAAQQQPEQEQPWEDWYAQDPIATQKALAEQAARDAVAQFAQQLQPQQQAVQGSQAEIVAGLAYRALEDKYGQLTDEQQQEMARVVSERPYLVPQEASTSPQKLADALDVVYKLAVPNPEPQTSSADLQRAMKLQAQSATGAGGHLSPADEAAQRWQEIANANTGKLGL